jgi:hypothetical protein
MRSAVLEAGSAPLVEGSREPFESVLAADFQRYALLWFFKEKL